MKHPFVINSKGKFEESKKERILGWTIVEKIGIAVINTRGIAKGSKSVIIGH
jgi:hypothetical protein